VFGSIRSGAWGLYRKNSDGTGNEELLFQSPIVKMPMAYSPDGKFLIYYEFGGKTSSDLWVLPLSGDRKPYLFQQSTGWESHAQFSPDGKWVAYNSFEAGGEVYVQPFPPTGAKWLIDSNGACFPRWSPNGRELYYMSRASGGQIMAVEVSASGATFKAGIPKPLFDSPYQNFPHSTNYHTFAVSPDGRRFLIPRPVSGNQTQTNAQSITIVVNWLAGVRN
jgi:dipeptidyl aminopeptidase/acylaminoacyl peptidase